MTILTPLIQEINAPRLKELLNQNPPPVILDVREEDELEICAFPSFIHIPLGRLGQEWETLPQDRLIIVACHHGRRSLQAALFLKSRGFGQVINLAGGIHQWGKQIDPQMREY